MCLFDRAGTISGGDERLHETRRESRVERFERGNLPPPGNGLSGVAARERRARQRLERSNVLVPEHRSLALGPARESIGGRQMESVEERSGVQGHCACVVAAPRNGRCELGDVTRNERWIEAQLLRSRDDVFGAQVFAKRIDGLGKCLRAAFAVGVGPEESEHLVAAHAAFARACEEREDGHAPRLRGGAGERLPVAVADRQPSECVNADHARLPRSLATSAGKGRRRGRARQSSRDVVTIASSGRRSSWSHRSPAARLDDIRRVPTTTYG